MVKREVIQETDSEASLRSGFLFLLFRRHAWLSARERGGRFHKNSYLSVARNITPVNPAVTLLAVDAPPESCQEVKTFWYGKAPAVLTRCQSGRRSCILDQCL